MKPITWIRTPKTFRASTVAMLLVSFTLPAMGQGPADVPPPPPDQPPTVAPEPFQEDPPSTPPFEWPKHPEPPVGFPGDEPRTTRVITLPEPEPIPASQTRSHIQGDSEATLEPPRLKSQDPLNRWEVSPPPVVEPEGDTDALRVGLGKAALTPGDHIREFDGIDFTGWIPPDTVMAVGSQHVVEAVNSGLAVYNKLGTEVQGYRSFDSFFGSPNLTLFDPKIVWSPFHNKFAMLVLARNTNTEESRFYLAISQSPNALGDWWYWSFNAESLGDQDRWLDFASIGADPYGVYVTGNMYGWSGSGAASLSKLWAISPQAFNGGPANNWVWRNLEWSDGAWARSPEVAHAHTAAFDEATFLVNTHQNSGSEALLWRIVGDRHSGAGLLLYRYEVDIDDYDALGGNVNQPGSVDDLDGGKTSVGNAIYANRSVFFSLSTDVNDDGTRGGLRTYRVSVDSRDILWSHLLNPGAGRYYMYPALALRGWSPDNNIAVFYTYTSDPEGYHPSAGYKVYDQQPVGNGGVNYLYQLGWDEYENIDSKGRNRWGDYSGASYDWQCGHLWGAIEYAGNNDEWRTRIKAISGNGESPCPTVGVVFPNGPDEITIGSTHQVQWDATQVPPNTWIVVFYDNGRSVEAISPFLPPTARSFTWEVPKERTDKGRISVAAWDGEKFVMWDWSDFEFSIR